MISKWGRLRVKLARALVQEIVIPEFGIQKVRSQPTHLVNGDCPIIFIASDSESPHFTTHMISHSLAELFGIPSLRSDIALILDAPERQIDDNFWGFLNVPELPTAWITTFEASTPPSHLNTFQTSQMSTYRVESSSEVEMSSEEAEDIIHFINNWEQSSAKILHVSAQDEALASGTHRIPPSLKRHSILQFIMDDDENAEVMRPNIRSGFAGEFFVASLAKVAYIRCFGNWKRFFQGFRWKTGPVASDTMLDSHPARKGHLISSTTET